MKDYLIDFKELRPGKLLWDMRYGVVTIINLEGDYPISVSTNHGTILHYDKEGKACIGHSHPILLLKNPLND